MKKLLIIVGLLMMGLFQSNYANNIQITAAPKLLNRNDSTHTVFISFPLSWENSWKTNVPNNWDAAWVFAKFREGAGDWLHVYIDTIHSVHKIKANASVTLKVGTSAVASVRDGENIVQTRGLGAFVYRTDNGKGEIKFDTIALKWKYSDQDLDDGAVVSIRVFAIEMVYVPKGVYELGDRTTNNRAIRSLGGTGDISMNVYDPYRLPNDRSAGPDLTSIFKNMGAISYPTGAINTVGNGNNGAPVGWYAEQGEYGVKLYRNSTTAWSSGLNALTRNPISYSGGSGLFTNGSPTGYIFTVLIKMPKPFKADVAYFGGHNWNLTWFNTGYHEIDRFRVRGSKDSVDWVDLAGDITTNIKPQRAFQKRYTMNLDPVLIDTFQFYEFTYHGMSTSNPPIIEGMGIADETPTGFPENKYYYTVTSDKLYRGVMPIRWTATNQVSSPTYPNGYEAFYIMKYELSQHAYIDFLNTLSQPQQAGRVTATIHPTTGTEGHFHVAASATPPTNPRNYLMLKTKRSGMPGYYTCYQSNARNVNDYNEQGGNIAMCLLNWADNAAYLCWSGLRPLTELEYEKACKGPSTPMSGMYAWGTNNALIHSGVNSVNIYTGEETISPKNANFICQGTNGIFPVRVGCLATQTSTRVDAGASYYGVMNLSDNVSEIYINCETPQGLAYNGEHGSGLLDGDGNQQIITWPANSTAAGAGIRGVWANAANTQGGQVANRDYMNYASIVVSRYNWLGCRGGRTAPIN